MLEHQVIFNVSYLFNNFYNEHAAFLTKKSTKQFSLLKKIFEDGKSKSSIDPTHSEIGVY